MLRHLENLNWDLMRRKFAWQQSGSIVPQAEYTENRSLRMLGDLPDVLPFRLKPVDEETKEHFLEDDVSLS